MPKLTYVFSVLPTPDWKIIKMLKQKTFEFIWGNKRDKVKREVIIQQYDKGGLKMLDIEDYIKSIKISWIKRLKTETNTGDWKHIYMKEIENKGNFTNFPK